MQRSTKNKYTSLDLSMIKGWNKIPTKDNTQVSFLYECTASSPSSGRHILGSAFLVVALGLYRRCPFLGVFVINVKHLKGDAWRDSNSNMHFLFQIQNPVQLEISEPNLQPSSGKSVEFHICTLYSNLILGTILHCYLYFPIVSVSP